MDRNILNKISYTTLTKGTASGFLQTANDRRTVLVIDVANETGEGKTNLSSSNTIDVTVLAGTSHLAQADLVFSVNAEGVYTLQVDSAFYKKLADNKIYVKFTKPATNGADAVVKATIVELA